MKNFIFNKFLIVVLFFYSCSGGGEDNDLKTREVIVSPKALEQTIKSGDLIDNIWQVKLETTKDNLFGTAFTVLSNGKYIYIYDMLQNAIFIFDMKGNYVNKIDKQGRGPGEYVKITDVQLSFAKDEIILSGQKKLLYYSETGEFIKSQDVFKELYFFNRKELSDGRVAYFTGKKTNLGAEIKNHHLLIKSGDNKITSYFPNAGEAEIKIISMDPYITGSDDEHFFHLPFRNTIYSIKEDKVKPVYNINITGRNIPSDVFEEVRRTDEFKKKYFENNDYITIFGSVVATNEHIIVPLCSNNWKIIANVWISRKTNNYIVSKNIILPTGDLLSRYPRTATGDTLITVQDDIEADRMSREVSEELSNPTVTFFTLKSF